MVDNEKMTNHIVHIVLVDFITFLSFLSRNITKVWKSIMTYFSQRKISDLGTVLLKKHSNEFYTALNMRGLLFAKNSVLVCLCCFGKGTDRKFILKCKF